jgi:hypothetical protein
MTLEMLQAIGRVFYYGVAAAAVLRGDQPLRQIGVLTIVGAVITPLTDWDHVRGEPYWGEMMVDIVMLSLWIVVLLHHRRWWLVVGTSFFLMSVLTHFAALIGPHFSDFKVLTVRILWNCAKVAATGCGLVAYELRRRKAAPNPPSA